MKTGSRGTLLAALFVSACGDGSGVDTDMTSGELVMAELDGHVFLLDRAEGYTPVPGTTVRVSFNDASFGFSGGCNSHGGAYALDGNTLLVKDMASTAMGCEPALHAQDDFLSSFFASRPMLNLDGSALSISGTDVSLFFLDREVADPDRALVGTLWTIDTVSDGEVAMGWASEQPSTLIFEDDGGVAAALPCGALSAGYTVSGSEITFTDVSIENVECSLDDTTVDAAIRAVLADGPASYEIQASRLSLSRGDHGVSARAE